MGHFKECVFTSYISTLPIYVVLNTLLIEREVVCAGRLF